MRTVLWEPDAERASRIAMILSRGQAEPVQVIATTEELQQALAGGDVGVLAISRREYGLFAAPQLFPELVLIFEDDNPDQWHYLLPVTHGTTVLLDQRRPGEVRIPAVGEDRRIRLLRPSEINWGRAAGRHTVVSVGSAQYRVAASIGELQHRLAGHGFLRVNRSILVRTDAIRELQPLPHGNYLAVMCDGATFVTSRQRDVLGDIEAGVSSVAD